MEIAASLLREALVGFEFDEVVPLGGGSTREYGGLEMRAWELGANMIEVQVTYRGRQILP